MSAWTKFRDATVTVATGGLNKVDNDGLFGGVLKKATNLAVGAQLGMVAPSDWANDKLGIGQIIEKQASEFQLGVNAGQAIDVAAAVAAAAVLGSSAASGATSEALTNPISPVATNIGTLPPIPTPAVTAAIPDAVAEILPPVASAASGASLIGAIKSGADIVTGAAQVAVAGKTLESIVRDTKDATSAVNSTAQTASTLTNVAYIGAALFLGYMLVK